MKKLFWVLLGIVAVVVAVGVTALNPEPMTINLGFFIKEIPTSLALLVSMLLGAILGWIAGVLPAMGKGRQLKKTQKKLVSSEKELESLRKTPAEDKP